MHVTRINVHKVYARERNVYLYRYVWFFVYTCMKRTCTSGEGRREPCTCKVFVIYVALSKVSMYT